jgi:uncharacterized protein (DUF2384 family)
VTEQRIEQHPEPGRRASLDELARAQGVKPVESLDELALDVWESDEELDDFLADVRSSRDADLA